MKSTAANIEKKAERWSLSWQPDSRCDSFTKEAILAGAPPTSGVYGLYNFDCQVFIGESENIQEALLRHESETEFQSRHLQPTGFTFESCAGELRKSMADALIARFHPVLQTEAGLTEPCCEAGLETSADHQESPVGEHEKLPNVGRHFHFTRTHGAALAALFLMCVVALLCLGIPTVENIQTRVNDAIESFLARIPIAQPDSAQASSGLRPHNVSSMEPADRLANQSAKPTLASASAADQVEPVKSSPHLSKKWSVQVSAAPTKDIADTLAQRLKANDFDGYVVQAVVKGQTYYRVRVGHFEAREEAALVRQSLARQESYRDAYLTVD